MRAGKIIVGISLLFCLTLLTSCNTQQSNLSQKIFLKEGWNLQSSAKVSAAGAEISSPSLNTSTWYKAAVPSTVMGSLLQNGLYEDIFIGENIKKVDKEQFNTSWWYRNEFKLHHNKEQYVHLHFDGISYYANIWLNGKLVAPKDSVYGTFRRFDFDVTNLIQDSTNVLAVEVFRQQPGDFGLGFADWNPRPPDENMGIWRDVYIDITGAVQIKDPTVESKVNTETLTEASITIKVELANYSDKSIKGTLKGKIDSLEFDYPVELNPHETKSISLTEKEIPALHIINPRLWWCVGLGDPNLYRLKLSFQNGNKVSDTHALNFGIRQVEDFYIGKEYRGFKLNGKKVLIKGAGWTDDIFLRDTEKSNEIQIQYVKHMNLNTIRLESFWGTSQNLYDLCDKYGILNMVGYSCQWEWENYLGKACDNFGGIQTEQDMSLAVAYLDDQVKWLRHHPSIITWFVGSDKLPKPELEERYKKLIQQIDDRPYLAAAASHKSTVSGPTGVKMNGPYDYEAPGYWYLDSIHGGAFGFNTETGPGAQMPVKESILKMMPKDKLWPLNDIWNFHCTKATEAFNKLDVLNEAMEGRYGKAKDLDEYVLKSGVTQYEAMKPMFEAFRVNQKKTTGIIQWMLNSAWPSFYWQLYDYYLVPTTAYYAVRKANEPIQLIYNYGDGSVYAVNETYQEHKNHKAKIQVFSIDSKSLFNKEISFNIDPITSDKILSLDRFKGVVFLSLQLYDDQNKLVATNFYWLSDKPDEFAWNKTSWTHTPMKSYADFKSLNKLSKHDIKMSFTKSDNENDVIIKVVLNNSNEIAFFTELSLLGKDGNLIRPVFWNENYFSLLPGETKEISCKLSKDQLSDQAKITLSGWNAKGQQVDLK